VQASTSQVLEISDQTSGVGALLASIRLQGIVKGTPGGDLVLNNIMNNEKIEVGDLITTSGGDRIFPKGLPIGTVISSFPGRDVFLNVRLKPAAKLEQLEEVLVITEIKNQEPDTKDLGPVRAADILAARLPSVPQQTTPVPGTTTAPAQNAAPTTQTPQQNVPAQNAVPQTANPKAVPRTSPSTTNSTTTAPKTESPKPAVPKKAPTQPNVTPQISAPQGQRP
jgi:rod shape-determining protein MreC